MRGLVIILACALFVGLLLFSSACTTAPVAYVPTATPIPPMPGLAGAIVAAGQAEARLAQEANVATVNAAIALATLEAARLDADAARLVPLAQAQATNEAINAQARIQQLNTQATASAWSLHIQATTDAQQAAAAAQAYAATANAYSAQATTMARDLRATAQADYRTATAEAWAANATAQAGYVNATIQAAAAEREQLALERERRTQPVRTWGPWAIGVVALAGLAYLIWRAAKVIEIRGRVIRRDERGDAPLLVLENPASDRRNLLSRPALVVIDSDRQFEGVTTLHDREVSAPHLADPERQERVTTGDQVTDLMTRGLPGGPARPWGARVQTAKQMIPQQPRFVLIRPDQPPPAQLVDRGTAEALDAEWEVSDG